MVWEFPKGKIYLDFKINKLASAPNWDFNPRKKNERKGISIMVLVTDKQFYMEPRLVDKLNLMINRFKMKMDNLILIDGDEGYGKTNLEAGICYYIAHHTGRKFDVDNIFFDLESATSFARDTSEQIIAFDEGALGGLAAEWWKKNQIEFIKLLMIARKKKHFFVICIPKFFKLNEYIVVDRSIALIHVYARNEVERGRFVYYSKLSKEKLFYNWRKTKQRRYKQYYDFRGSFLEYLPKVVDEDAYEAKKDEAIMNFNKREAKVHTAIIKKIKAEHEMEILKRLETQHLEVYKQLNQKDWAKFLGITPQAFRLRVNKLREAFSLENEQETKSHD